MRSFSVPVIVIAMANSALCAPTSKLDAGDCRPAPISSTLLTSPQWSGFGGFSDVCDIRDESGNSILRLFTVSAKRLYAQRSGQIETLELPKPMLLDAGGKAVAALPYSFPDDPPFALEVTFSDWSGGWPGRIEFFLVDPTVSGNRALPAMVWDAASRQFIQTKQP